MKMKILLTITISSLLLASCTSWEVKKDTTTTATGRQNITSTGITPAITSVDSGSQTPNVLQKAKEKTTTQEPTQPQMTVKSTDEICLEMANTMDPSREPDFPLIKSCALRAAVESGSFKYCLDHYQNFSDSIEHTQDGVNECARMVIIRAIEGSVKKNGGNYPKGFCENAIKEIQSGGDKSMDTSVYRDGLDENIANECIAEYATLSQNAQICTDDSIWEEPFYSREENRAWAVAIQNWKKNECIWSVHLKNPEKLSSGAACSKFQQTTWGTSTDGPCGFADSPNSTNTLRAIAAYGKIPSVQSLQEILQSMLQKQKQTIESDIQRG